MKANDFVIFALRSPLHVIMGDTMLLTVTGRKTRRKISLPVNYYQDGSNFWVVSSRDRTWWRNLRNGAGVDIHIHGRDLPGFAELVLDEKAVEHRLADYIRRVPHSDRYLGVRVENDMPNADDLCRAAHERLFIRICVG